MMINKDFVMKKIGNEYIAAGQSEMPQRILMG